MKNLRIITLLAAAFIASCTADKLNAQNGFITGLENGYVFSASDCGSAGKTAAMSTSGNTFKIITFQYGKSTVTAAEDAAGRRNILFMDGKPNTQTESENRCTRIGFDGDTELKTNEYAVGTHDFTDDGQPELVIGIRTAAGDGFAVYIFEYSASRWRCIGDMITTGRNVRSCRVFRQTITIKDADSGVLYTWTWHDGHFDFLSSDNSTDPATLISPGK